MKRARAVLLCLVFAACSEAPSENERGATAIQLYGCGACHRIPGIAGADGVVGPRLDQWSRRVYLAGVLPNTPENLVRWIRAPQEIDARTAMPDLRVTQADAEAIAVYLYRLH
jgi:cytochrome c